MLYEIWHTGQVGFLLHSPVQVVATTIQTLSCFTRGSPATLTASTALLSFTAGRKWQLAGPTDLQLHVHII